MLTRLRTVLYMYVAGVDIHKKECSTNIKLIFFVLAWPSLIKLAYGRVVYGGTQQAAESDNSTRLSDKDRNFQLHILCDLINTPASFSFKTRPPKSDLYTLCVSKVLQYTQ